MALPDVSAGGSGHVAHHNTLHDWSQVDDNVRYVSKGAHASDSNDGRTPFQPKATVQSAYDTHPGTNQTLHIYIGPGRYDQGANGLQLTRNKPARFYGVMAPQIGAPASSTIPAGNTVFHTSSGSATKLVSWPNPGTLVTGQGFMFDGIGFEVNAAALVRGIDGTNVSHCIVQNCLFSMFDRNSAWGIYTAHDDTLGNDHSWWRVDNNWAKYGGLFFSDGTSQSNQHVVTRNECYGGPGTGATPRSTNPAIRIEAGHRCSVSYNNVETYLDTTYGGIYINDTKNSTFIGNGGENPVPGGAAPAGPFRFHVVAGSSNGNFFAPQGTNANDTSEILIQFTGTARYNEVHAPMLNVDEYSTSFTNRVKDDTTDKRNWIFGAGFNTSAYWWTPHLKRGAGTPESVVQGAVGDLFIRSDGGAATSFYVKESGTGTTGWVAK